MAVHLKKRSLVRGMLLNGLIAIAFVPLNLLLMGIPSVLVILTTLPLATILGSAAKLNSQLLNVALYLTFLWPPSFVVGYWVGFGVFRQRSKLIKGLIYCGILYAWANIMTFVLSYYFAQSSQ
jgi:hypothetical protein